MNMVDLSQFEYDLPVGLLAHAPATPRDSARLFVYDTATDEIHFDTFANVANYLPSESFLVLNNTKVVPARVEAKKETGGKVELLLLLNEWQAGQTTIAALADRKITVGQALKASDITFTVKEQQENVFILQPSISIPDLLHWLEIHGTTPVPRYLEPVPLPEQEARERYQSIFATTPASVAAPTASLHFTPKVFESLAKKDIEKVYVTLHVGLGTFAPLTEKNFDSGTLHTEFAEITAESAHAINEWRGKGKKLIAVGTTATRVLESHATTRGVEEGSGLTDIFITPGYRFKAVDGLITNFHLPKSSLMMLVEAFLQHKGAKRHIKELYEIAMGEKFRFYSFGDAMLIV